MALGFFRRRQKMVIIIMVVLMVSFLVGSYGFNMLFSTNPMTEEIGRTRAGKLLRRDWYASQADLDVLRSLGLGGNPYRYPPWPTEAEYTYLVRGNGERVAEAYMLLLAEARTTGILVTEGDVDRFFAEIGYGESRYKQLVSTLRSSNRGWTEQTLRGAAANWLLINKAFTEALVSCPPSEAEIQLTYRDVTEKIDVRGIRLKAEDYLKDVPDPNQAAIDTHFNLYRTRFPNQTRKVDDMGFGYRQPGRARVQYLFVRGEVIERVTEPAFDLVVDYFNRNKGEFVKKVPIGPATAPAGEGTSQPASQPTRDVPMTFAEAKEQVIEKLRGEAAAARMDEVVSMVEIKARRLLEAGGDANEVFAAVRKEITRSADKDLAIVLRGVKINNLTLAEAVGRLAGAAKLRGICFPWGSHGTETLLESVKVSLVADGITLGEALKQLARQVKWPPQAGGELQWVRCEGFSNVLFSIGSGSRGVDFFPVAVQQTPLNTLDELAKDEVLGYAFANPAGGRTLAQTVFSAEGLTTNSRETPMARLGAIGTRMYVMGDVTGRLVWRLVEISQAHVPASLADRPGLRDEVVRDLKRLGALKKAIQAAGKFKDAAETVGLSAIAATQKREVFTTGLFPRRTFNGSWSEVPKLDLSTPELQAYVIPRAFELAPKNVEPGGPEEKAAVGVVPIGMRGEVLVLERAGFDPVVRPQYEEFGRIATARFLAYSTQRAVQALWFDARAVRQRVGYER